MALSDLFVSEAFSYWLVSAGSGVIMWVLGYLYGNRLQPRSICLPRWLLLLCGIRHGWQINYHRFAVQLFGLLVFVWATVAVLIARSREERINLFVYGFLSLFIMVGLFLPFLVGLGRKSGHD
jgi:hypothetical protein